MVAVASAGQRALAKVLPAPQVRLACPAELALSWGGYRTCHAVKTAATPCHRDEGLPNPRRTAARR
jgi:hypothetical protein